jgi:hypothetical protein
MGSGMWSADTYNSVTSARISSGTSFAYSNNTHTTVPRSAWKAHEDLKATIVAGDKSLLAGEVVRESRDSDEHPTSVPVVVMFDVTGSMAGIPKVFITKMKELFSLILRKGYIEHPQVLIGAVGDAYSDSVPLQVAQFESDNRVDEALDKVFLEGGGGGGNHESYDLAMWYIANCTATDAFEKRGKKGYCNTPDAPIWMKDQTFKPLGKIEPGDEIMGWAHANGHRILVPSVVIGTQNRMAYNVVELTMESGRKLRCTADHKWLSGHHGVRSGQESPRDIWTTCENRYGKPALLSHVVDPVDPLPLEFREEAAWLAGIYDGEGSGVSFSQYETHNPDVCERIGRTLTRLGFKWVYRQKAFHVLGGLQAYVELLNWLPVTRRRDIEAKILSSAWAKYEHGEDRYRVMHRHSDRIHQIDPLPPQQVVSMQTTTGNYFAWGYASKNCFFIGDERSYEKLPADVIEKHTSKKVQGEVTLHEIVESLKDKWEAFFIQPVQSGMYHYSVNEAFWRGYFGDNLLQLQDPADVAELIAVTIGVAEGVIDLDEGLEDLKEVGSTAGGSVSKALEKRRGATGGVAVIEDAPSDLDTTDEDDSERV